MTVSTAYARQVYTGDGVTTAFNTVFPFDVSSEIVVTERVIATGAETTKTLTTDYSVSGGSGSSGTVTAVTAPASTVQWILSRGTAQTQAVDYSANDAFPAETHEGALDKLTRFGQETYELANRGLHYPISDGTALSTELPNSVDRASSRLGFDANGEPVAVTTDVTGVAATATGAAIATAANVAAANAVIFTKGTDITSATTITIPTDGSYFDVTGTTAITGMTVAAGRLFMLQFDGALTLTDGATLDLAGQNITTAAGYRGIFHAIAADTVQMVSFIAEGQSPVLLDEDNMASDSAAHGATQQSIKAYADSVAFTAASQAEMEAASSTTVGVTPGRQHFHPGHTKAWVRFDAAASISASYGVASVDDDGTANFGVNWTTAFSSSAYLFHVSAIWSGLVARFVGVVGTPAAGSLDGIGTWTTTPTRTEDAGLELTVSAAGDFA